MANTPPKHEPTLEEIRQQCRVIRRGWSADKERERRAWSIVSAMTYVVGVADVAANAVEARRGPVAGEV